MAKTYAVIVGTRPNFVKAASFLAGVREAGDISCVLIHTGQHFDDSMSRVFFDDMEIPEPDVHLSLKQGTSSEQLGSMINDLTREFTERATTLHGVIVFGDVNSSLAASVAASRVDIPLTHIEAGLRSHDKRMPEETNRIIIDHLAHSLMISEESARLHLNNEGIKDSVIYPVGSLMIESLERFKSKAASHSIRETIGIESGYVVATIHRSENLADPELLKKILHILATISQKKRVVFPMHPGTRARIRELKLDAYVESITIVEPLGYLAFLDLVLHSSGVVTDSGGIQEETSHLGIPCCTLRDNTERPVTVELGSNRLFSPATLDDATATDILKHLSRTDFKPSSIPLWDREVSKRIVEEL